MKNGYSYLHSLCPITPPFSFPQKHLIDFVLAAHQKSLAGSPDLARLRRFAVSEEYIQRRYSEYGNAQTTWEDHLIYHLSDKEPAGADIKKRNEFYAEVTLKRFGDIYQSRAVPQHLIHVTCTGYISPSAPQVYFSQVKNYPQITHAYHMGCYASLPSVRIACALNQSQEKTIDIVHNEICSIHMDPSLHLPEQIVVQTLFSDGHIFYQVGSEEKGFRILGIKEKIIPESGQDMSWIPSPSGMSMTLSRKVPHKIEENIIPFVMEMAQEHQMELATLMKEGIFAIHPGGPKIIECIQRKLELRDDQLFLSKKVLYERGNMSSATLPHIWEEIHQYQYPSGTPIISLAFGPGLTIFGSLFEVV